MNPVPGGALSSAGPIGRMEAPDLSRAFERFIRSSDTAQQSFAALRGRVEELKRELEETNRQLREKVAQLDRLNGHFVCLLESLGDGVVAVDAGGTITLFNAAAERLTGERGGERLGRPLTAWLAEEAPLTLLLRQALRGAPDQPAARVALRRAEGAELPVAARVTAVRDRAGCLLGAVLVLQDLAEGEELRRRLREAASLASLGQMAAVLAHEIRNPLGGIEGFATLLKGDLAGRPEQQRYVGLIIDGLQDINRLVSNLLTFARLPELRLQELDLRVLLPELAELALADRRTAAAAVRLKYEGGAGASTLLGDRGALRQLFLNLFRNAFEALEAQGGGELRVRWRETRLREIPALVVEVADTGPGVAPGAREKLFLPFLTTKSRGTGLGLPTVAKLAAAHGGQVEYREEAGGGACFCVTLPRRAEGCFTGLGQAGAQHAD